MGAGIAQLAATIGARTILFDPLPGAAGRGATAIENSLAKAVERGKITPEGRDAALALVDPADDVAALAPCELVIEAAPESPDLKRDLFAQIAATVGPDCVIASNTSSIPITAARARWCRGRSASPGCTSSTRRR